MKLLVYLNVGNGIIPITTHNALFRQNIYVDKNYD